MSSGLKVFIVFTCLALLAGMGYLVYRASQPTIEDAYRESERIDRLIARALKPPPETLAVATLKSDLRNLLDHQMAYHAEHRRYTIAIYELPFRSTRGVSVDIARADSHGFSATAQQTGIRDKCAIYVGPDSLFKIEPAKKEAEPGC